MSRDPLSPLNPHFRPRTTANGAPTGGMGARDQRFGKGLSAGHWRTNERQSLKIGMSTGQKRNPARPSQGKYDRSEAEIHDYRNVRDAYTEEWDREHGAGLPKAKTEPQAALIGIAQEWIDGERDDWKRDFLKTGIEAIASTDQAHASKIRIALAGTGIYGEERR